MARAAKYALGVVAATIGFGSPSTLWAQDGEIMVTASRSQYQYYEDDKTVIGLKRKADSAVQQVWIVSDSRDREMRKSEIQAMLRAAMSRASASGVTLVNGDFELEPIDFDDWSWDSLPSAGRTDTSQISFYVKAPVVAGRDPSSVIDSYLKSVPVTGRSLMEKRGALTLTIINPDQYRDDVIKLVAEQSLRYASYFGRDYGVDVSGLDSELKWAQVGETEVFLYIPYRFSIKAN